MKLFLVALLSLSVCWAAYVPFVLTISQVDDEVGVCSRGDAQQCDAKWKDNTLPCGQTICAVGCAMSSVANALPGGFTPGSLNTWLKVHGGYEGCDLIWGTVNSLGMKYLEQSKHDLAWLSSTANNCNYAVIANVLGGSHWVLLTGYAGNGNFYVHDPAGFHSTYAYDGIVTESVYTYS
eukprot:TRINITY_DN285_c0_g1_i2.p1 TRINITY_DN285_c0_g1~~TRINITY_DN285_c0_g1_i2.p1  ORF type:complete len:179 (-),score=20.96 TRINITY_DN285_c0_g1_i2:99-635(-)